MKHIKLFENWVNENDYSHQLQADAQERLETIADALGCNLEEVIAFTVIDGANSSNYDKIPDAKLRAIFGNEFSDLENLELGVGENIFVDEDEYSEVELVEINGILVCVQDGPRWNGEAQVPVLYICKKLLGF